MDDLEKRAHEWWRNNGWAECVSDDIYMAVLLADFARKELEAANQELTMLKTDLVNKSNNLAACNAYASKADKEIEMGKAAQCRLESEYFNLVCQLSALRRELESLQIIEEK